ncbi:MAG: flagellar biosynthetic protein FliR, partial [Candidatus Puniceispirillaceae bacterium]
RILPVGSPVAPDVMIAAGIGAAGSMFLSAAIIMLPIAMVLLMINVTVGIISRSAPTLNLFSFGFPITLLAVFILLYVSVGAFATSSDNLIDSGLSYMQTLIGDLANG